MIRGYCCQFDTLNDECMSIVKSLKNLFYFFQKTEQTKSEFHEDFMALVEDQRVWRNRIPHLFSKHDQEGAFIQEYHGPQSSLGR